MAKSQKPRKKAVATLPFPTEGQKIANMRLELNALQIKLDRMSKNIDAQTEIHAAHLALLGNFASHDLKNSLQSIDAIISTHQHDELSEEHLQSIKYNVQLIRETLKNFSKLVIHSGDNTCTFDELIQAIKIVSRDTFSENNINFNVEQDYDTDITFHYPFTVMFLMLNNLVINAVKALEVVENDRKIEIHTVLTDENILIKVFDNAPKVDKTLEDKIFEFGYSTTNGSGIGLFHARYVCEIYKGTLNYHEETKKNHLLDKCFVIELPLIKEEIHEKKHSNN
ncbi:hypothetical protein AFK20_12695 [Enhydrobacter aerosaccus]|uniref:Histidine kinase domain-containing protein n=1 Tax=Enhydrobacter aerosaccus TaxID=225324 RepID=A0ABR5IIV4_9HYPH|nr:HAMP domain-containing sensor histidine kinase [Enhydrobacter aerosaccus]KND16845.1 hypothetical protein AFK20_12695 [Enhydrobacter aerosaccus]